jgi:hypothetical protein
METILTMIFLRIVLPATVLFGLGTIFNRQPVMPRGARR